MTYEIEIFGTQTPTGIPSSQFNSPNFPPNYPAGQEKLSFATDIFEDPGDTDNDEDPSTGWSTPGPRVSEI